MTFAMSTEGDSVKSALSEANDKNATDNHTDSSQDSADAKEVQSEKPTENNIGAEKEVEKPKEDTTEGESEQESEASEKKDKGDAKKSEDKPEENEKKPENNKSALKKEEKDAKSEEEEEEEEEEDKDVKEVKVTKKEEKDVKDKKDVKESKDEKCSSASEKDEEEDEAEGKKEEEASEEEAKPKKKGVPLLDQPLQMSGKRERKNVQRLDQEPNKLEDDAGAGTPLGEIPRVEASITRFKNDDLKVLYKILYKSEGKTNVLKKNIKKFNGFPFKKDSEEYKKRVETCAKLETKHLKSICEMLDLQKTGTKSEIVDRIMDFLLEPKDSGRAVGGGRPKRASAVRANNRGYSSHDDYSSDDKHSRARRDKGKRPNLKEDSSSDEEFKPGDASDASDEKPRTVNKRKRGRAKKGSSEEDEASLSAASSDESDDVPKTKRRKSITKTAPKAIPRTPARGRGRPSKGTPSAVTPRKSGRERKPVRKHESSDEDEKMDDGSSSEDEPLVKKKAKVSEPPTDDEIKTYIKSILEGANLEEITMKTVCQRVYDNYPDFDLTARKNFIKSTVKSLIST